MGEAGGLEPEAARHGSLGEVAERAEETDVAPVPQLRRGLPHQDRDERRLPGAVAPDQADLFAGTDHEGRVRQKGAVAYFDGEG